MRATPTAEEGEGEELLQAMGSARNAYFQCMPRFLTNHPLEILTFGRHLLRRQLLIHQSTRFDLSNVWIFLTYS